jgi:hypothetical protein
MKNNQTIVLFLSLLLACFAVSCGSSDNSNANANGNRSTNSANNANSPKKVAAADCPATPLGVKEFKDKGKDYEGCSVSVQGKLWEVKNEVATLIDTYDRTDYNGALYIGGNFTDSRYFDIQMKVSKMKIEQQYDKLPVVTFTGIVETVGGSTGLKNGILGNVP